MTPDEIDKILKRAANETRGAGPDGTRLQKTEALLLNDLRAIRPLAPAWIFALIFGALLAVSAAGSAWTLGIQGFPVLNNVQRALIFSLLFATGGLAAAACAREMRPAAGSRLGALALIFATAAFPVLFSLIFRGYDSQDFVSEGVPCLRAGLAIAMPVGLAIALIFRRGFVLNRRMAGLAAGSLAGLAGLAMLELHCSNLKAIHVMVWHVSVVIVSGLLGLVIGWILDRRPSSHLPGS